MRWSKAWGLGVGTIYGTAVNMPAELNGGTAQARLGIGIHGRYELQPYPTHRWEFGGGAQLFRYAHVPAPLLGLEYPAEPMDIWFLDFYVRYKMLIHAYATRFYVAPGVNLEVEQNHLRLNRNFSGIGAHAVFGVERVVGKFSFVFAEVEARMLNAMQFKTEPYPWRLFSARVNLGFSFVIE